MSEYDESDLQSLMTDEEFTRVQWELCLKMEEGTPAKPEAKSRKLQPDTSGPEINEEDLRNEYNKFRRGRKLEMGAVGGLAGAAPGGEAWSVSFAPPPATNSSQKATPALAGPESTDEHYITDKHEVLQAPPASTGDKG